MLNESEGSGGVNRSNLLASELNSKGGRCVKTAARGWGIDRVERVERLERFGAGLIFNL